MELEALVTIDLPGVSENKRDLFYEKLEENNWKKIDDLTTAWQVSFNKGYNINEARKELKSDIKKAKSHSKITDVNYAIQVGQGEVITG